MNFAELPTKNIGKSTDRNEESLERGTNDAGERQKYAIR